MRAVRTIHLAYTAPRGNTARRIIDKAIDKIGISPLHRSGYDLLVPWKKPVRAPHSISYNLLHALRSYAPTKLYGLRERTCATMKPGDIFLAQPVQDMSDPYRRHPDYRSVTWQTLQKYPDCNYTLILPYSNDERYIGWLREIISRHNKSLIIIGGKIWTDNWHESPIKDTPVEKMLRVDMAIDPLDYPVVKDRFNGKGKRKYLYIGHDSWYKNTEQLEKLAASLPNFEGAHIGMGTIKGWRHLADFADLTTEYMRAIASEYDIFVNVSTADPQATTVLEQMCFGLAVACTPESGYEYDSLTKLSTHDTEYNIKALQGLQEADESELLDRARTNRQVAIEKHSWDKFCGAVTDFIGL